MAGPSRSRAQGVEAFMPTDLSNYFIAKKFRHGWLMQEQNSDRTIFISRENLIRMGYLHDDRNSQSSSRRSWGHSEVIVVPTGPRHQRSHSDGRGSSESISIPNSISENQTKPRSQSYPSEGTPFLDKLFEGTLNR